MAATDTIKKTVSKSAKAKNTSVIATGSKKAVTRKVETKKPEPKKPESKKLVAKKLVTKKPGSQAASPKKAASKKTNGAKAPAVAVKAKPAKPGILPEEIQLLISKRAYYKWEKAGYPDNAGVACWLEAENEIIEIFS